MASSSSDSPHGSVSLALLFSGSNLSTRSFSVKACSHASQPIPLSCGVPHQGSVLDPLLFILYTTQLSHLKESSSANHCLYADDTQLFISFSPGPLFPFQSHSYSLF